MTTSRPSRASSSRRSLIGLGVVVTKQRGRFPSLSPNCAMSQTDDGCAMAASSSSHSASCCGPRKRSDSSLLNVVAIAPFGHVRRLRADQRDAAGSAGLNQLAHPFGSGAGFTETAPSTYDPDVLITMGRQLLRPRLRAPATVGQRVSKLRCEARRHGVRSPCHCRACRARARVFRAEAT
jgi:hypothetical protein